MAIIVETPTPLGAGYAPDKQVTSPNYMTGSFVVDDTLDHQFKVPAIGKSKMTILVNNASSLRVATIKVYGMHAIDALVDAVDSVQIGTDWTIAASGKEYQTVADPFPFYCIQITMAAADVGVPVVTLHVNFHSGS